MSEYQFDRATLVKSMQQLSGEVYELVDSGERVKVKVTRQSNGTLSLDRHWRALMAESAKLMAERGVTMQFKSPKGEGSFSRPINSDDCHELFTSQFVPLSSNGKRKSWSKSGRDKMDVADTGERCQALERLYAFWMERGINLSRYEDSEYEKIKEQHG